MPLNIKNAEVEALVAEVARLTGETKTEAVPRALLERREGSASASPIPCGLNGAKTEGNHLKGRDLTSVG